MTALSWLPELVAAVSEAGALGSLAGAMLDAGALRAAIQKHLRGHRNVKSFRLGRYGEGESGVTVVELK